MLFSVKRCRVTLTPRLACGAVAEWSRDGRHTGRTDVPLTPAGEQEARALVDELKDVAPWVITGYQCDIHPAAPGIEALANAATQMAGDVAHCGPNDRIMVFNVAEIAALAGLAK